MYDAGFFSLESLPVDTEPSASKYISERQFSFVVTDLFYLLTDTHIFELAICSVTHFNLVAFTWALFTRTRF